MEKPGWAGPLGAAYQQGLASLSKLPERRVGPAVGPEQLRAALDGPSPENGSDPRKVIDALVRSVDPGLMASSAGRFFGFVIGGATPAALGLADRRLGPERGLYAAAPDAAIAEEVTGRRLRALLGLPASASVGFVTGARMANFTGLAAARHEVLRRAGWDAETGGLMGAPPLRILVGQERHDIIDRAVRFLGLGTDAICPVDVDKQGRMVPESLGKHLAAAPGPTIVCAQAGHVNTGAAALARRPGAEVLNDVVLTQVLVRFPADDGDHDGRTRRVIGRVQHLGICWMGGTSWRGQTALRISVSNWSTDEQDLGMAVDAILRCAAAQRHEVAGGGRGRLQEHRHPADHP